MRKVPRKRLALTATTIRRLSLSSIAGAAGPGTGGNQSRFCSDGCTALTNCVPCGSITDFPPCGPAPGSELCPTLAISCVG
jgi:hypothetical protein